MILTGPQIIEEWKNGAIHIDPFDEANVNPNSYNFTLGKTARLYDTFPLDAKRTNPYYEIEFPKDGFVLTPRCLYLCATEEIMGSTKFAPTFAARSSVARMGLFINLSASLGDIGFIGQWTLQLFAILPLRIYPGMKIGQMMWWKPHGAIKLYDGKYQHSRGPQSTQIQRDFSNPGALSDRNWLADGSRSCLPSESGPDCPRSKLHTGDMESQYLTAGPVSQFGDSSDCLSGRSVS